MQNLAPIGLSTYARLTHLQQTVTALQCNYLAPHSELFVFSDAPRPGDEGKVAAVRDYLRSVDGFRRVTVVERESNSRVYNNRQGMRSLLDTYGHLIWLEEDVVTAPGFLSYMNQALEVYRDNQRVMSICGYCPPILFPPDYRHDVYFLRRFNAWGFGIWRDRFELIEMDTAPGFARLQADPRLCREFSLYGEDMLLMVKADATGDIDALDVKIMLSQFFLDRYTVYPLGALTRNIGFDGTGTHCGSTDRFDVMLAAGGAEYVLPEVFVDHRIIKAHARFRRPRQALPIRIRDRFRWFETRIRKSIKSLFAR